MQSIISKGKNVKEAVNLGIELLDVEKSHVDVEIIQQESKGFLGIGTKQAVVKVSLRNVLPVDNVVDMLEKTIDAEKLILGKDSHQGIQDLVDIPTNKVDVLEGKVWVKDSQLFCKLSPSQYPTVSIGKGVRLLKNGSTCNETTVVLSDRDTYKILTENEEKETVWSIILDQPKLRALLYVKPGYKIIREVQDMVPEAHLTLVANEIKQVNNTLSYDEIMKKLEFLRVKQGFVQENILNAIKSTESGEFEIATGMKAKKGQDGWVELKVDIDDKQGLQETEDGKVDFRESRIIPTVERGKVIAVIHPPVPGKPGLTVTGEPLPPNQTLPIELKLGKGVTTVDDKIVATEPGRPKVEMKGRRANVSILSRMVHQGDVNLETGNLRFLGDVEIHGNVMEQMCVEANGDILVHSTVNFAKITSQGAIVIKKNIVSSELSAGKNNLLIAECGHMLGVLSQQIEQMNVIINQLMTSSAFKQTDLDKRGLQPLIKLLLEKRFKNIVPLAKQYVEVTLKGKEYFDTDDWRAVAVSINHIFLSLSNQVLTYDRILELTEKMKKLHEWSKHPAEPQSYITISSVLNSKLYSSGNVSVIGQGSVNTKIHAGGLLKINGVVRGGELYGKQGIEINEVGSEMGTTTILSVPYDQRIKINKVFAGTVLKFGNIKYTFNEQRYGIEAFLNHNGDIDFNY